MILEGSEGVGYKWGTKMIALVNSVTLFKITLSMILNVFDQFILPVLMMAAVLLLTLLIKNFFPSYFNEKGRNAATKEDISEITHLIESVKTDFIHETEKLKAELQLDFSFRLGLMKEERLTIINLHESFSTLINCLIDFSMSGTDADNNLELKEYMKKISNLEERVTFNISKFEILIGDKSILIAINKLSLKLREKLIPELNMFLLHRSHQNAKIELIDNQALNEELLEQRKKIISDTVALHKTFVATIIEEYKEVLPMLKEFTAMCRDFTKSKNYHFSLFKLKVDPYAT